MGLFPKESAATCDTTILDEIGDGGGHSRFAQRIANAGSKRPNVAGSVTNSAEFQRILALPRRPTDWSLIEDVTDLLKKPGGTMRLHAIQSAALVEACQMNGLFAPIGCGDGKCCRGDTEIYDEHLGRRRMDEVAGGSVSTPAFDVDHRISYQEGIAAFSGEKECLELRLADGSSLVASADHPVMTQRGWVSLEELRATDFVATPRSLPEPKNPLADLTDDDVKFAAYLIADGSLTYMPAFSDDNPEVLDECIELAEKLSAGITLQKKRSRATAFYIRGLLPFLDRCGIDRDLSKHKRVPSRFYRLPNKQIRLFLNRFWACDGHVGNRALEVTLASEGLVHDLRFFLNRLGIHSRMSFKNSKCGNKCFPAWRIMVTGEDAIRFLREVGVHGQKERTERFLINNESKTHNTNVDIVPIGCGEQKEILDEMGLQSRGRRTEMSDMLSLTRNMRVSRSKFARFCSQYEYTGKYSWLARADVRWEKIKSVEPAGIWPVYDVSVPSVKNFVANNVVVHNSLITYLLPTVLDSKKTVLLVPPALRDKLRREVRDVYGKHFRLPMDVITVVAYSELSSAKSADILEQLNPDLVIADEAHMLKRRKSARTKRFLRFMKEHPECRFCALSGTVASRSIEDFAHLIELALRKASPLPRGFNEVKNWGGAIDVKPEYVMRPGALMKLCNPGEDVRSGFRRRLTESPGVVSSTGEERVDASLIIRKISAHIPPTVVEALNELRDNWTVGGEPIADVLQYSMALKQIACGFYYRFIWPGGVPDYDWLAARSAWARAVNEKLKQSRRGMDSQLLLQRAADRGEWNCPEWFEWKAVKDRPEPPRETIWIDEFLCHDALHRAKEYAKKGLPCIIWCESIAMGEKLSEISGLPYYGAGTDAEPTKHDVLIASRVVQGTGKNLQYHYASNIFTLLCGGKDMEQTLARTHRNGQQADEVFVDWYAHTIELEMQMEQAKEDARFQETLSAQGKRQRLLYAEHL